MWRAGDTGETENLELARPDDVNPCFAWALIERKRKNKLEDMLFLQRKLDNWLVETDLKYTSLGVTKYGEEI